MIATGETELVFGESEDDARRLRIKEDGSKS
jgi:hypothetical protein